MQMQKKVYLLQIFQIKINFFNNLNSKKFLIDVIAQDVRPSSKLARFITLTRQNFDADFWQSAFSTDKKNQRKPICWFIVFRVVL